ncbi:MAG: T9SS type A sorting domain-containing protein [Saprospiraceae bacterium]|nr:T9SS type A sorting domain-containing protein [Saprospiraceae bacterium]
MAPRGPGGRVFFPRPPAGALGGGGSSGPARVKSDGKRSEESIIIAPNPVTDVVNVFGLEEDATYRITDFAGKQYLSGMIIPGQTLDVADLKPGFYIVTIQNGAATSSSKMVKK